MSTNVKKKLNAHIVNSSLKSDRDCHHMMITCFNEDIFHLSTQDLSQDQQAHWQHGTSGQNPQIRPKI